MADCLYSGCTRAARLRGCCKLHYAHYRLEVSQGDTTWQRLEEAGKVLPSDTTINKLQWLLIDALDRAITLT